MVVRNHVHMLLFFLLLTPITLSVGSDVLLATNKAIGDPLDYKDVISSVNIESVKNHLRNITSFARVTGSSGCNSIAFYIRDYFNSIGLSNVTLHRFNVTIPLEHNASFTLLDTNRSFRVSCLEPNLVVPVICNITAPIVYVGSGSLNDLNNKTIKDRIILMDYNTGYNWVNAAKFGAKAVIFIEPEETTYREHQTKSVPLAFNFPRFYISRADAAQILSVLQGNASSYAHLEASMSWEEKEGLNVFGTIRGDVYPDQIIILSAHYDAYSVVPVRSFGANDAVGIATLLELARFFKEHGTKYTLMFVAFSGHHQGLTGARVFVNDFFWKSNEIGRKVILQINLQLSTLSNTLGTTNAGRFGLGSYWRGQPPLTPFDAYVVTDLINSINQQSGKNYKLISGSAVTGSSVSHVSPVGTRPNDCEPLSFDLGAGYSFVTVDFGDYLLSPEDTYEKLNLHNLRNNVEEASSLIYGIVSIDNLFQKYLFGLGYSTGMLKQGYNIDGKVAIYDKTTVSYVGVPGALVHVTLVSTTPTLQRTQTRFVIKTDSMGRFHIPHIIGTFLFEAFYLNTTTGNPIYSPDMGKYMWSPWVPTGAISMGTVPDLNIGYYTIFKGATAVLFDTTYPLQMNTVKVPLTIDIYDESLTKPESYGYSIFTDQVSGFSMAAVYLPPDTQIEVALNTVHLGKIPLGFLANSSEEGWAGYELKVGQQVHFCNTPMMFAKEMYYRSFELFSVLSKTISMGHVQQNIEGTRTYIEQAEEALRHKQYDKAFFLSISAWRYALETYIELRETYTDTGSTIIFFGLVLVPFALMLERLIFGFGDKRRILSLIGITAAFLAILYFIHPGFTVASNALMVILGFSVIILISPILLILFSNFTSLTRKIAIKIRGLHFAEVSRGSAAILSFQLGAENLKKRRIRTALTLVTIFIIVFALSIFTSISITPFLKPSSTGMAPQYQGIYIRPYEWIDSLGQKIVEVLRAKYADALVLPRAWLYSQSPTSIDTRDWFKFRYNDSEYIFYGFLGLSAEDPRLLGGLVKGRWFVETDEDVCILTKQVAEQLGIEPGAAINALGKDLRVVGIIDSYSVDNYFRELDAEKYTPFDQTIPNQNSEHVASDLTVVVPYKMLILYNPLISAVTVIPRDPSLVNSVAQEIFRTFSELYIFAGVEKDTLLYTLSTAYVVIGLESQIIPVAISALILFNTMMSSIYERTKELFTYSALGLSPLHVAFLFLSESSIVAIVGALFGYVASVAFGHLASTLIPGMIVMNYSSSWVVTVVEIAILITVLSSLYPMWKVSKLATPSLERAWAIPSKPLGNQWEIPLPFSTTSYEEISGICAYLREYIRGYEGTEGEDFSASNVSIKEEPSGKSLEMDVKLAPYEQGIRQRVKIAFIEETEQKRWSISLLIERKAGPIDAWERLNRQFIDKLRKQLLLWSSLKPEERNKYVTGDE